MKTRHLYPSQDPMVKLCQEMKLRNFSQKTIKSYLYYITSFLQKASKGPRAVDGQDIKMYLEGLANSGRSASTINIAYSALLFYFVKILRRRFFINIPRAKKRPKLPRVFSKDEVKRILASINNVKHKLMLGLMYSSGLRVSEVVRVRVGDLDFSRKLLYVRQGKGAKDRVTIIAKKIAGVLKRYVKNRQTDESVFASRRGGRLSERTVQKVFALALKRTGMNKGGSCHSLRHSFAIHLLESGTDIRYIQELLGHSQLTTTQVYTKVADNNLQRIKSPLD